MVSSEEIRLQCLKALQADSRIGQSEAIGVSVKDGVATLSGVVGSYDYQIAAAEAIKQVPGVEAVVQNIQVKLPTSSKVNDIEIAKLVGESLDKIQGIPREQVMVTVKDGWITLEGQLNDQAQKELAESAVNSVEGVKGVTNNLEIQSRPTPLEIQNQIAKTFQCVVAHHAQDINVQIKDNKVILSGIVRAWIEKVEAERACRELPGIAEVENNLEVTPLLEGKEDPLTMGNG